MILKGVKTELLNKISKQRGTNKGLFHEKKKCIYILYMCNFKMECFITIRVIQHDVSYVDSEIEKKKK